MDKATLAEILNAPIIKRSVMISGHATSVSIEKPFWDILKKSAQEQETSINKLITLIDDARPKTTHNVNLSSAIRLYVLNRLK
ncbi:MAG: ribbon-helix-helix domain-containing protein [Alphaproteobacteria bacterium]|nr:ribbon-helix-helix domain-containing protein [Alphaproteobacteria bacterium]NCQ88190.1 ribbon-helix-helix domain-containing protein [Alphaproteobacteria bacterium]NCT05303.1 ribbon-helix-helix domain-containing protein [Alphaproteobacteria bacterium]